MIAKTVGSRRKWRRLWVTGCAAALVSLPLPALAYEEDEVCVGKPGTARVQLTIEGIRSDAGLLTLTLYHDDSSRFLRKKGSHYVRRVPAAAPETRLCFIIPEPGVYAVAVYHDANANQKLDRSGIGPPTEGFGFSNNASTLLGLPHFNAVRIRLADDSAIRIRLRYLNQGKAPAAR